MTEKVCPEHVFSTSPTGKSCMRTGGMKRNLSSTEISANMTSPCNASKRLKLSEKNSLVSNVKVDKNSKEIFENSEVADIVKTRTHCRRKLTAENLKTILRYLLANDSVLTMVRNTMKLQKGDKFQLETEGQPESTVPNRKEIKSPWPSLTPKKPDEISKKLLEEDYSEESASDEDYQPNEEELSDEDAAASVKTDDLNSSKIDEDILPDLKPLVPVSDDEDALVIVLPETNISHCKKVDKIAQRTRSKLCLNDTPLETIESSFQPPDITMDMYDTHCDDADWTEFLCEFTKPLNQASGYASVAEDTEDEKDPEYKVQEEEEEDEDEFDYDEICGENPLEVPGDEVNALMTEILEFAQEDKSLLDEDFSFLEELSVAFSGNESSSNNSEKEKMKNVSVTEKNENSSSTEVCSNGLNSVINSKESDEKDKIRNSEEPRVDECHLESSQHVTENTPSSSVPVEIVRKEWIIPDERRQLDEQMRMYVQILTQSYLLSHGYSSLDFINVSSRLFLCELKIFASKPTYNNQRSAFYAHNLDDAMNIVTKFESLVEKKQKPKKINKGISDSVKRAFASSKAFIYPELLPKFGFCTLYCGSKASFSTAEDNLIALGLDQFSYMDNPIQGIQQFLLPTKSEYQIKCRIKNSKQKRDLENRIAYFCQHKKLAEFNRVIRVFDPNNVKPPGEYPLSSLPEWMAPYTKENIEKRAAEKQKPFDKKPKLILPRMQIVPAIIQEFNPPDPLGAPQPLICQVYSVNENNLLKGSSGLGLPKRINRKRKKIGKNQRCKSTQFPEPSEVESSESCISQSIKEELQSPSEGSSDEESIEYENNSDSSEYAVNLRSPLNKRNPLSKRTVVTRSMSTSHECCQTDDTSFSVDSCSLQSVSIKEEPLSRDNSDEEHLDNIPADNASHSGMSNPIILNDASHSNQNQLQAEYSTMTQQSLRIVTSQGDESSDSDENNAICTELIAPIQKFYCGISEDAVLPPVPNSVQNQMPSDFSTIRDIILSEEKSEQPSNSKAKSKVQSKKSRKSKKELKTWSTEEDQLIISNCQKFGINKRAFRASANEIGSVTHIKVKQRFIHLLKLLSEKLNTKK